MKLFHLLHNILDNLIDKIKSDIYNIEYQKEKYLDICPKDQDGKIEKTSQCIEYYIYLINHKKLLTMTKNTLEH